MSITNFTEQQKKFINTKPAKIIVEQYIDGGHMQFPGDIDIISDLNKRQEIENIMKQRPNPQEQSDWAAIEPHLGSDAIYDELARYVNRWGGSLPSGNHVAEARAELQRIEDSEWSNVDPFNLASLYNYLRRFPMTVHKTEIDDSTWSLLGGHPVIPEKIQEYLDRFPSGKHAQEAQNILEAWDKWKPISDSYDMFEIKSYIDSFPKSPFLSDARRRLSDLKTQEIDSMRNNPGAYDRDILLRMLNEGIISPKELFGNKLMSPEAINILRNYNVVRESLPNLADVLIQCENRTDCTPGNTDIYLFGIPSTGKTCVLMGLIGSNTINVSFAASAGKYAESLQRWIDTGMTPDATRAGVGAASMEGVIRKGERSHNVNLIEMSGEDFAFKLAGSEDANVSLTDLGDGLPEMLANNNRKTLFFIVDPTVDVVTGKRSVITYQEQTDEDGNPVSVRVEDVQPYSVSQKITLRRMINLLEQESNRKVMEKVDAIHFIVTKSDTLGSDEGTRSNKAYQIFERSYRNAVGSVIALCERYGINAATGGIPKLYTFSLGKFFPGGVYEYESLDADKLVNVISGNTSSIKKQTFWDRFKAAVN